MSALKALVDHSVAYGTHLSDACGCRYMEVMTEFGVFWTRSITLRNGRHAILPDLNAVMIMEAKAEGTMLDIGANIGRYSMPMALKADHVLAFEPDPGNYELLRKGAKHFPKVKPLLLAVAARSGELELFQCSGRRGNSSLARNATAKSETSVKVRAVCLDDYCRDIEKITAIKIDVEGAELEVFLGGQETLNKHSPVISLETHAGIDERGLTELIRTLGYTVTNEFGDEDVITGDRQYLLTKPK
jgi:FkbM family methyltransferase